RDRVDAGGRVSAVRDQLDRGIEQRLAAPGALLDLLMGRRQARSCAPSPERTELENCRPDRPGRWRAAVAGSALTRPPNTSVFPEVRQSKNPGIAGRPPGNRRPDRAEPTPAVPLYEPIRPVAGFT